MRWSERSTRLPARSKKLRRRLPIDWVFCYAYNSLVPHDVLMKTIERFWTEVRPRVA